MASAAPSTAWFVGALLAGTLAWIAVDFGRGGASAPAPRALWVCTILQLLSFAL